MAAGQRAVTAYVWGYLRKSCCLKAQSHCLPFTDKLHQAVLLLFFCVVCVPISFVPCQWELKKPSFSLSHTICCRKRWHRSSSKILKNNDNRNNNNLPGLADCIIISNAIVQDAFPIVIRSRKDKKGFSQYKAVRKILQFLTNFFLPALCHLIVLFSVSHLSEYIFIYEYICQFGIKQFSKHWDTSRSPELWPWIRRDNFVELLKA